MAKEMLPQAKEPLQRQKITDQEFPQIYYTTSIQIYKAIIGLKSRYRTHISQHEERITTAAVGSDDSPSHVAAALWATSRQGATQIHYYSSVQLFTILFLPTSSPPAPSYLTEGCEFLQVKKIVRRCISQAQIPLAFRMRDVNPSPLPCRQEYHPCRNH